MNVKNEDRVTSILEDFIVLTYDIIKTIGILIVFFYLIIWFLQYHMDENTVQQNINDLYIGLLLVSVGKLGIDKAKLEREKNGC